MSGRTGWQKIARRIRVPLGFVVAAAFLWLASPTWITMAESLLLVIPGLWLRAYASGYVRKNAELTTTGPYAHTRNPLYLGSMLIAFGFAGASGSWIIAITLAILFALIYIPTIQSEETYLRTHFPGFDDYARAVPRLLPRITPAQITIGQPANPEDRGRFSPALYWQHREYNSLMGAAAIYLALAIRLASEQHILHARLPWQS
ncbi:MAG TPA: isoprenylcysteine carboxylmethyltransferase family protein [Acidobacteriaceae bacterium]|nr:isoprenylcysteine carboxylmethyltransferase family protein [Acidobacteriaceae bacterium]